MTLVNSRPELMNLSFSGCGFLCVYHAGVAAAIKEYAPQLLQKKILGASAGSIIACGLITDVCISNATSTILKVVSQARSRTFGPLHPEFNLLEIVREELERILPSNAYELCTGRLIISLTRWSDHKNVRIEEYSSNSDLIDAIMCSCFIPLYCGLTPPKYRGVQYIDGGVSDNQPFYDDNTVTVSPFSGESDICPPDWDSGSLLGLDFNGTSIRFTARNMFRLMACLWPRSTDDLSKMCLQGFGDALRFLTKFRMAPCIRCLTIQTIDGVVPGRFSSECLSDLDESRIGMPRIKKRSSMSLNGRIRMESECETCCESDLPMKEVNVNTVFPSIMKKAFDDAVMAEESVFQYILSFRLVRYATTALGIGKFPIDVALAFAKKVHEYLAVVSPPEWIMLKFQALADFIMSEVERQKSRYTKFSCLVAVTETDRYGSMLSHSSMENQEEKEIELSEEAKRELRILRERDRKRRQSRQRKIEPCTSSHADEIMDVDSLEHVIEFTRSHEAMYEFHYLDENNKMRTINLFAGKHRPSPSTPSSRLVHVPEEEEEEEDDEKDSGLSGVEVKSPMVDERQSGDATATTSKRDACCSPVRDFSEKDGGDSIRGNLRSRGTQRRYPNDVNRKCSTTLGKKKSSTVAVFSSDSEEIDGSEKLFVPSRKAWRASSDFEKELESQKNETAFLEES